MRTLVVIATYSCHCLIMEKVERTSMLRAFIFPKGLIKWGRFFKSMNCANLLCMRSNRYVNHVKSNF